MDEVFAATLGRASSGFDPDFEADPCAAADSDARNRSTVGKPGFTVRVDMRNVLR
jgi:hypothetical protein